MLWTCLLKSWQYGTAMGHFHGWQDYPVSTVVGSNSSKLWRSYRDYDWVKMRKNWQLAQPIIFGSLYFIFCLFFCNILNFQLLTRILNFKEISLSEVVKCCARKMVKRTHFLSFCKMLNFVSQCWVKLSPQKWQFMYRGTIQGHDTKTLFYQDSMQVLWLTGYSLSF